MAINYFARPTVKPQLPASSQPTADEPGMFGNIGRAAGSGALSAAGGIFDFVGAEGVAKQFYGWSDAARQSMSQEAQQDMAKPFFDENQQGDIELGEGLADIDTWLLTLANVAGQFVPTAIPGAGLASAATKVAKLGATGAKVATATGMGLTGGSAATGQGMEQARQEYLAMPDEIKAQSELFRSTMKQINTERPGMDADSLWNATDETIAAKLADDVRKDPATLLANFAGSAIADPIIGKALTGARLAKSGAFRSAAKGFAIEGSTEAGQAGVQEYGVNKALAQVDGRDPTDGVMVAALNEGFAGGGFGAAAGAAGGFANRPQAEPVRDPDADAIRETNPDLAAAFDATAQSAAQREADMQSISNLPAVSQPVLEGELLSPGMPATFSDSQQPQSQQRPFTPYAGQIEDKNIIFGTDDRSYDDRAMQGEYMGPEGQPAFQPAGLLERAAIDAQSEQRKQAQADMERMRNAPRQITDKNVIFAGDGRPQQAAQEFTQNLQRGAEQSAAVPRLPQKDIIFAGDQSGVTVKGNGVPFQSPKEALASKSARVAKKAGQKIEAVQFADGYGWRVTTPVATEQAGSLTSEGANNEVNQSAQIQTANAVPASDQVSAAIQPDNATGIPATESIGIAQQTGSDGIDIAAAEPINSVPESAPIAVGATDSEPSLNTQPAADLSGEQLDPEWTAFADDSGTLKIPRAEMPQIKAEHRGAMTQFLKARGVTHEQTSMPAAELKPTQAEFSPSKVRKAMGYDGGDRRILVSSDGFVLDGHHQWLAKREKGDDVDIIKFDAPISELVEMAREFPSSTVGDGVNQQEASNPSEVAEPTPQAPADAGVSVSDDNQGESANLEWAKDAERKLWRSGDGQIITDESFGVGGLKTKFFPVYANQKERNAGNNYASGASLAEAKSKVVKQSANAEPSAPINDFGEKLGGARKDVWVGFSDAINSDASTAELPLSKAFPEPDYVKMAADGVPMETLAIIAAMRAEIPAKPRQLFKVRRWAEKVDVLRSFASDLIGGELTPTQVIAAMSKGGSELQSIADAIPAIAQANPETIKLAAKYRLGSGTFSMFQGQDYRPAKTFYFPQNGRSDMLSLASDNKQTALDNLVKLIKTEAAANPDTPGQKQSKISVYQNKLTKQVYLGWEGGSGILRIQNFDSIDQAREALKNNRPEIEDKLKTLKATPDERRPENRNRVGIERFAGSVTPAIFADTFGFRGVEFGNYVEQGKRQKDLNEAYDALMDLADVLGVPPKALALNGELGIAFGARGKGGQRAAKAHYERGHIAINMTKESGAGSLAHEWWHAVDNYFARMVGKPDSMATDGSMIRGPQMRKEVRQAFTDVMTAIKQTNVVSRSSKLDERRSKPYWSTTSEASARSFEAFIISELESKGFNNDYLANILEPEAWNALEEMQGNLPDQTYPYPTKAEQATINPAFSKLFDTLQTKETDKGTMLFSKQNAIKSGKKPTRSMSMNAAQAAADKIIKNLSGAAGIKVVVLETQAELEQIAKQSLDGTMVRGAYDSGNKTAYVIAENLTGLNELRTVLAHEVLAHGGLDTVIGKDKYNEFIDRLKQTRSNKSFSSLWSNIDRDYDGMSEETKAEELFAYYAQNKPITGPIKFWWNAMKRWLHKTLVSVGLAKAGDPDLDLMDDMIESIRAGFMFNRSKSDANIDKAEMAYSRTATAEPDNRTAKEKLGLEDEARETLAQQAKRRTKETIDTLKQQSFWQRMNEGIFDGMAGIKDAEESVGITDPNQQGYVSARLASGLADVLHAVFNYGAPEWRDGVVARKADTKGMLEVFGMLGDDLNNWLAWMGANRAEKLMAEGRENNLTEADIAELKALANGKEALFEEVRQEYNKINSAVITLAQEAGLISEAQRGGFDEEWYVPFFRDMDVDPEMEGVAAMVHGPKSKQGMANQSAKIKELKGGKQSTKDLLENIIQRQSTLIDAALKNKAMLEIVENLSGTDYMEAVTSPDIAALSQTELNMLSKVKVMRDGKAEAYAVSDPALLRGLLQINDSGSKSLFNRMARSAKRFVTAGITLSPDFIFKNFVRDAAHAWMINKDDFKFGTDSIKGIKKAFKEDELYRDLIFSGAAFQGGYVHGGDPEAAAQQIRRTLAAKGLGAGEIDSYMDSLVTKGSQLFEMYRNASDKFENANRLSTYEAALAKGKSKRQAAFESKDLMDYSLKGNFALIGTMIDMLPFFNARLQGMSKLVRAARAGDGDRVLKVLSANLAMKGMKVAAFSLALAAMNDDDERYKELPDFDKDGNWHFWIGDDHFRIPKPFELGIVFGTIPERMLHYGTGSQPASDLGKSVAHAVFNTLALNPIPQIALPMVEVMTNKSFFKGSAIEGMADENKQAQDRYNAYTSDVAKLIGEAFGVSPKKVEHIVTGYTGTLGGYVLGMSDMMARQMLGIEKADTPISRYPVVKAFYQGDTPKTATKFQDEFYDAMETANQAWGSYKRAVDEGDVVRQQELKESESKALGARVQLSRVQRQLSDLSKQAEMVNNSDRLSSAQKREKLDEITLKKNALYSSSYVRHKLGEW